MKLMDVGRHLRDGQNMWLRLEIKAFALRTPTGHGKIRSGYFQTSAHKFSYSGYDSTVNGRFSPRVTELSTYPKFLGQPNHDG